MTNSKTLPTPHKVQSAIHRVRDPRVVLAEDLAQLSGKSVSAFNQAVSRKTRCWLTRRPILTRLARFW